jgi:hypothetical protein
MAHVSKKDLLESEIDKIVTAQADNTSAWEEAIEVEIDTPVAFTLPPELAAKASFFAQLHDMDSVEAWLRSIIRERITFEESAFAGLKQVMEKKATYGY